MLVGELLKYKIGSKVFGPSYAGISSSLASSFLPIAAAGGVAGYTVVRQLESAGGQVAAASDRARTAVFRARGTCTHAPEMVATGCP